jgi:hypothetical protein
LIASSTVACATPPTAITQIPEPTPVMMPSMVSVHKMC